MSTNETRSASAAAFAVVMPRPNAPASPCVEALDRLPWRAGLVFEAYGARIGVRVTDPSVLDAVARCLPTGAVRTRDRHVDHLVSYVVGGSSPASGLRRFHLLYAGSLRFSRTLHAEEVVRALASHLELAVAEMAPRLLFVHAGVVGWKGRAIVLPGRSHTGKSTLVAALLRQGAAYCSDEYAAVDRYGRVHPYPRPLTLRLKNEIGERVHAASQGAATARAPLPVGLIAVTRFVSGASWRPRQISPARAVMELLANSVSVRKQPERTLAALDRVALRARTLKGPRGEADDVARRLLDALEVSEHEP